MRKFKKGDKIYHPKHPETIVQVDDIQEIHQHYVCTSSEGEPMLVPFFCEKQWELVEKTEPNHKFNIGDIISPIGSNTKQYRIVSIDVVLDCYILSNGTRLPFINEVFWELVSSGNLSLQYELLANDYLSEFIKQTGIEDDAPFWVGGEVAGIASVADYFVDYTTIRYVVDGKMSFEDFDEWYCYCNEVKMIDDSLFTPTLEQWCYGEFTRISDERLEYMKKLKKNFEQLVQEEKEKQN